MATGKRIHDPNHHRGGDENHRDHHPPPVSTRSRAGACSGLSSWESAVTGLEVVTTRLPSVR